MSFETCLFHWSCLWLHLHQHHWFFMSIWTFSGGWWASKATYCMWTLPDWDFNFCGIVILMFVAFWFRCRIFWICHWSLCCEYVSLPAMINMPMYGWIFKTKEKNILWIKLLGKFKRAMVLLAAMSANIREYVKSDLGPLQKWKHVQDLLVSHNVAYHTLAKADAFVVHERNRAGTLINWGWHPCCSQCALNSAVIPWKRRPRSRSSQSSAPLANSC